MTGEDEAGGTAPPRGHAAEAILSEADALERAGRTAEAVRAYEVAIAAAEQAGSLAVVTGALRRLAVQLHHRGDVEAARERCARSVAVARTLGDDRLAAEALNTLGGLQLSTGMLEAARATFLEALQIGGASSALRARVEQNLGIIANIQGELDEAFTRYRRSLDAYLGAGDEHGCAIAYNNLGLVSSDRGRLDEAEHDFRTGLTIAMRVGDTHLRALCLVNRAEVEVARQRYENARQGAEEALELFGQLGALGARSDGYRVLGMVFRETGRPEQAEARFREAMAIAVAAGNVLGEAEATQELAVMYQAMGRNQDALRLLDRAYQLFRRLDARVDLVNVGGRVAALEAMYLAVVRAWGRSLEAADPTTFGHCERVAQTAVAVARALGLSEVDETAVLLGAYLHDVGMVRVPREVLSRPGPLTTRELALLHTHPVQGVELLADVEFPWEIKPIIRWHHERCDGSGYPDGLRGEAIPLGAQIVGIAEAHDAMVAPRAGGTPLSVAQARDRIAAAEGAWSAAVVAAYLRATAPAEGPRAGVRRA
jgi:putative nucleotidyltransferase with HDIG domain